MIKHYILIKTKTLNKDKLLLKFYKNHIAVYDCFFENDELYLKVDRDDLPNIQDKIVTNEFTYVEDTGIYHLKNVLPPLKIFMIISFIILVNFLSQIIVQVEVIHSNKEIRELVQSSLLDYGIKKYTFKKDYDDLQQIKEHILASYKDKLEWLEIEQVGMKYIVRIEERIINNEVKEEKYCHIVASKSGVVANIYSQKGEVLVQPGEYVSENQQLISGSITFNEEVKDNVCAEGQVLAEVWYTANIKLPIKYQVTNRTGKMRYNLAIEKDSGMVPIFKSRVLNNEKEYQKLFTLFDYTFYLVKEYEVAVKEGVYDLESGEKKAIELGDEKINNTLDAKERIKSRKVLKKNLNNSTIEVELFYVVIEDITKIEEYTIETEEEVS